MMRRLLSRVEWAIRDLRALDEVQHGMLVARLCLL